MRPSLCSTWLSSESGFLGNLGSCCCWVLLIVLEVAGSGWPAFSDERRLLIPFRSWPWPCAAGCLGGRAGSTSLSASVWGPSSPPSGCWFTVISGCNKYQSIICIFYSIIFAIVIITFSTEPLLDVCVTILMGAARIIAAVVLYIRRARWRSLNETDSTHGSLVFYSRYYCLNGSSRALPEVVVPPPDYPLEVPVGDLYRVEQRVEGVRERPLHPGEAHRHGEAREEACTGGGESCHDSRVTRPSQRLRMTFPRCRLERHRLLPVGHLVEAPGSPGGAVTSARAPWVDHGRHVEVR